MHFTAEDGHQAKENQAGLGQFEMIENRPMILTDKRNEDYSVFVACCITGF
jgi:hypothetical protein